MKNYHIAGLQVENFKKIKLIKLALDGKSLVISGKNAQGKTSLASALWVAFGGSQALKDLEITKPIRDGEKKASITIDLAGVDLPGLKVTRKFLPSGETLVVENADGAVFKSPQAMLDAMIGKMIDPLALSRMKDAERKELLLSLVDIGMDLNQWEKDRKALYDERTITNRQIKDLEGQLKGLTEYPDAPAEEIKSATILAKMQEQQKVIDDNTMKRMTLQEMGREANQTKAKVTDLEQQIAALRQQITALAGMKKQTETELEEQIAAGKKFKAEVEKLVDPDLSAFEAKLQEVDQTNAKVRANKNHKEIAARLYACQAVSEDKTAKIEQMDKDKAEAFAKAKMPIEGLSVDENGITYKGQPFGQASTKEKIEVGLAVAAAASPKIGVVWIPCGESLDSENFEHVLTMCEEKGLQVLVEKVGDPGDIGIEIVDGSVVEKAKAE